MSAVSTPVICGGELYRNIPTLALAFNKPVATVFQRIRNHQWTPEEAVGLVPREQRTTGHKVVVSGVSYRSRQAACAALGLNPKIVHQRLKSGRSIEEAFGIKEFDYRSKAKKIVVEGKAFDSLRDACQHYRIDKDVLNARINRYGWSLEEALGVVQRPGYEKGVAGYVYLITRKACGKKYVGVTMGTVETRWTQHLEKAACTKRLPLLGIHHAIRQESPEAFTIQRLATASQYGELLELEAKFVRELNCKTPHGYNLTCGGGGTKTKGKPVKVGGLTFPSITAACKHFGKERRMSTFRLKKGWTIEQVMGLVDAPKDRRCGSRSTAVT